MTRLLPLSKFCLLLLLANVAARSIQAQNFVASDVSLARAAESARIRSALFWTGQPLPGDWSAPCPMQVTSLNGPAGGRTCFQFANGEVFNWNMTLQGEPIALLDDVIPHEVDHMVRATLVRRPIVRWLDEGCAILFESAASQEEFRQQSRRVDLSNVDPRWLTSPDYPATPPQTWDLYTCGFAFVEYLLTLKNAATLLELQRAQPNLPTAFERLYGFPLAELPLRWNVSRQKQSPVVPTSAESSLPTLTVWTASWCPPCQQFHDDLEHNLAFRERLLPAFHIRFLDVNQHAELATAHGIVELPTFETAATRWTGYTGPDSLLHRLSLSTPPANAPEATPLEFTGIIPVETNPEVASPASATSSPSPAPATGTPPHLNRRPVSPWFRLLPAITSLLPLAGILGGTALTGGLGGIGLSLLLTWLRRTRPKTSTVNSAGQKGGEADLRLPFPRALDEARELLQLRQSEGRVAVLDALRGMFLDDELERLQQSSTPEQLAIAHQLRTAIDQRIDEVAPLSTTISS